MPLGNSLAHVVRAMMRMAAGLVQVEIVAPQEKKALLHSKKNGDGVCVLRALSVCARVPGRDEPPLHHVLSCSRCLVCPLRACGHATRHPCRVVETSLPFSALISRRCRRPDGIDVSPGGRLR